jgi:hypothetical protein
LKPRSSEQTQFEFGDSIGKEPIAQSVEAEEEFGERIRTDSDQYVVSNNVVDDTLKKLASVEADRGPGELDRADLDQCVVNNRTKDVASMELTSVEADGLPGDLDRANLDQYVVGHNIMDGVSCPLAPMEVGELIGAVPIALTAEAVERFGNLVRSDHIVQQMERQFVPPASPSTGGAQGSAIGMVGRALLTVAEQRGLSSKKSASMEVDVLADQMRWPELARCLAGDRASRKSPSVEADELFGKQNQTKFDQCVVSGRVEDVALEQSASVETDRLSSAPDRSDFDQCVSEGGGSENSSSVETGRLVRSNFDQRVLGGRAENEASQRSTSAARCA